LVANARAVITAEAMGDPRFARFALELAEGVLEAVEAVQADGARRLA
jgi:hypothetical protein